LFTRLIGDCCRIDLGCQNGNGFDTEVSGRRACGGFQIGVASQVPDGCHRMADDGGQYLSQIFDAQSPNLEFSGTGHAKVCLRLEAPGCFKTGLYATRRNDTIMFKRGKLARRYSHTFEITSDNVTGDKVARRKRALQAPDKQHSDVQTRVEKPQTGPVVAGRC
jgi:hypothetical protein